MFFIEKLGKYTEEIVDSYALDETTEEESAENTESEEAPSIEGIETPEDDITIEGIEDTQDIVLLGLENLDTSEVTNMSYMFQGVHVTELV